ncbi:MAG: HAD-IA family hydrolase, partial [Candidatus Binataceae bacterium]
TGELRRLEYRWWRDIVAKSFKGLGVFDDFDSCFCRLFAFYADPANWQLDPAAEATCSRLHARGLKLGLVSNFDYRLYAILEGLGLGAHFDSVTISSEAGYAKPAPEIFQLALRIHGVAGGEAIHVGDSPDLDVAGALAAGITPILLDPTCPSRCRLENRMARISTLGAVAEAIDQLSFP